MFKNIMSCILVEVFCLVVILVEVYIGVFFLSRLERFLSVVDIVIVLIK